MLTEGKPKSSSNLSLYLNLSTSSANYYSLPFFCKRRWLFYLAITNFPSKTGFQQTHGRKFFYSLYCKILERYNKIDDLIRKRCKMEFNIYLLKPQCMLLNGLLKNIKLKKKIENFKKISCWHKWKKTPVQLSKQKSCRKIKLEFFCSIVFYFILLIF